MRDNLGGEGGERKNNLGGEESGQTGTGSSSSSSTAVRKRRRRRKRKRPVLMQVCGLDGVEGKT